MLSGPYVTCMGTGLAGRAGEGTVWRFINIELHIKNKREQHWQDGAQTPVPWP